MRQNTLWATNFTRRANNGASGSRTSLGRLQLATICGTIPKSHLHRRWKKLVVNMADVKQEEKRWTFAADGDTAAGAGTCGREKVVGLDFSPQMLAVAKNRLAQRSAVRNR